MVAHQVLTLTLQDSEGPVLMVKEKFATMVGFLHLSYLLKAKRQRGQMKYIPALNILHENVSLTFQKP